jgi:pimeloyl-ACP methyl ester carboxylesterase
MRRVRNLRKFRRFRKYPVIAVCAALLVIGLGAAAPSLASAGPGSCATTARTLTGALADGATYEIQVPANWNCTLFLYSHGYVTPGSPNPAADVGDPVTGAWLLGHGYALAGSSYATTGWAIQQALPDQISTLNVFDQQVGTPTQTIAWGHSLGGIITAGLIQDYPNRFSAALPMCGVLSGGVATWNTALDTEVAFQQLIDPSVQVVNITNPGANLTAADQAAATAQETAQGRARLALAAALGDTPGWFTPLSAEPAANDYSAQEANQYLWDTEVDFPFVFALRAELQGRAGGNPSWTTGVNFFSQLARSADLREVIALYRAAGLNLGSDLARLNSAARISADPAAVSYLAKYISFDGRLSVPVLTMHTTGDGLVVPENEQAYASVVQRAGDSRLLRQIFVSRAGHCAFTPAETITAAQVLLSRLATGRWNDQALQPSALNGNATALGPSYNIFSSGAQVVATPSAFVRYQPYPYLRPFDLRPGY